MKGIDFAFDVFGQRSEHDRSKMKWRMKVGIEWRPSMAGRPKFGGRSATFFLLSPPLSPSLAQPPHLWDRMEELWPHGPMMTVSGKSRLLNVRFRIESHYRCRVAE
jgi:hypothetical protein